MDSSLETTPDKKELKKIIKTIKNILDIKKLKNHIFSKSSLKYCNLDVDFYIFKNNIKQYYENEIFQTRCNAETIEEKFEVFNDFLKIDNLIIKEFDIIDDNFDQKFKVKNQNNDNDIFYKVYDLFEYENLLKEKQNMQFFHNYVLKF